VAGSQPVQDGRRYVEVARQPLERQIARLEHACEPRQLPFEPFPPAKSMLDGLSSWCRRCHNEASRAWGRRNPDKVAILNAAKRAVHEPRPCSECGEPFVPGRSDTLVCSDLCRWRRARRLRREAA
jgi:hypothetical protein